MPDIKTRKTDMTMRNENENTFNMGKIPFLVTANHCEDEDTLSNTLVNSIGMIPKFRETYLHLSMHQIDSVEKIHPTQLNYLCCFSRDSSRRRRGNLVSFWIDVLS